MNNNNLPAVVLQYNSHLIAEDLVADLLQDYVELRSGPAVILASQEPPVYAGIEWYIPTAICILVIKPYADGLLKEMAKDHYAFLKVHIPKLYQRFLAPDRVARVRVTGTTGKISEVPTFAREFSFEAKIDGGQTVRLLFKEGSALDDARHGTELFCKLISDLADDTITNALVRALRGEAKRNGWTKLVYFDAVRRELRLIDALRSARENALVDVPLD